MGNQIAVPFEDKTDWYKDWMTKFKNPEPIVYKGRKNKTICWSFVKLCKMTQAELKLHVIEELCKYGYSVETGDGYVYADGKNTPVLLTAHLDTVHAEPVRDFYEQGKGKKKNKKHILSSPQGIGGDDRCGVYMILEILKTTDYRPTILFCEDEEIGGVGSGKFLTEPSAKKININADSGLKFFLELDRNGSKDAVFYDCITNDFIDFIEQETDYIDSWGTFSDISNLCPWAGIAGVNLSCGYYKAHTLGEYVVLEEMFATIDKVKHLLETAKNDDVPQFIYEEMPKPKVSSWMDKYDTYDVYGGYYGDGYNDYYSGYTTGTRKFNDPEDSGMLYVMYDDNGKLKDEEIYADNKNSAIGKFMVMHSNICWNDVQDYEWIADDEYENARVYS